MRVVMWSGLGRVRLLPRLFRIPYGFVSFRPFSDPSPRAVSSVPIQPRLIRSIPLIASLPSFSSPITPRLSCRMGGADFLNASNSMPLKSGLRSGSFLVACLLTIVRVPYTARSVHLIISSNTPRPLLTAAPIPSRCRLANGAAVSIAPRFPPHPSCRLTGRECLLGCLAVNSVIAIVGWHSPYRACLPSSHHLIQFLSSPCPLSPAPSCLLALNNPPPPGVGGADGIAVCTCGRGVNLLASHHAVPLSRSSLVRYCRPIP